MTIEMIEVDREAFYNFINPRDIVLSVYKHETLFKTRYGTLVGKANGYLSDTQQYYLTDNAIKGII